MSDLIYLVDGYKIDHRRQYPEGTEFVYSNLTARSSRVAGADGVVFFGLQYLLQRYLMDEAAKFFAEPRCDVTSCYDAFLRSYLGKNDVGIEHIGALHDLGYLPLRFSAVPEGTLVPLGVPMLTVENTHPDFFWLTNYFETLISQVLWQPITSATTARQYRQILEDYAPGNPFVDWQAHDFSSRGMAGPEAAALSGAGHLLFFKGTDTLPAVRLLEDHYEGRDVGGSVPATEHSVMCAGGEATELETFRRLLKLYPTGVLSIVSDTWDLWHVVLKILPQLREEIMARDGKLVIRPDSGDPEKILCGDATHSLEPGPTTGLIGCLDAIFGSTVDANGLRVLDSRIGAIYGDSITTERARSICANLRSQGYSSTNVVFGVGSYTYQYVTRDTYGMAMKATWAQIGGKEHILQKRPATDPGKRSAAGRLAVVERDGKLVLIDGLSKGDERDYRSLLQPVWQNGKFLRRTTLDQVRGTARAGLFPR